MTSTIMSSSSPSLLSTSTPPQQQQQSPLGMMMDDADESSSSSSSSSSSASFSASAIATTTSSSHHHNQVLQQENSDNVTNDGGGVSIMNEGVIDISNVTTIPASSLLTTTTTTGSTTTTTTPVVVTAIDHDDPNDATSTNTVAITSTIVNTATTLDNDATTDQDGPEDRNEGMTTSEVVESGSVNEPDPRVPKVTTFSKPPPPPASSLQNTCDENHQSLSLSSPSLQQPELHPTELQSNVPVQAINSTPTLLPRKTTTTPITTTTTNLQSLPIDALHCIASFLTPYEFVTQYGTLNRCTQQLCRSILQRVFLHAYKCLLELIVTFHYYHQYEDALELAALYVQNGIPIYPHSLGHAYHTIYWKMNIEIQQQQQQQQQQESSSPPSTTTTLHPVATASTTATTTTTTTTETNVIPEDEEETHPPRSHHNHIDDDDDDDDTHNDNHHHHHLPPNHIRPVIDPFYDAAVHHLPPNHFRPVIDPFHDAAAQMTYHRGQNTTFLEAKCSFYMIHQHHRNRSRSSNTSSSSNNNSRSHTDMRDGTAIAAANMESPLHRATTTHLIPDVFAHHPSSIHHHRPSPSSTVITTTNMTTRRTAFDRIPVLVHQHLYDRHDIHYEYYIDTQNGTMMTPPINLSADLFHPIVASRSNNAHSPNSKKANTGAYIHSTLPSSPSAAVAVVSPTTETGIGSTTINSTTAMTTENSISTAQNMEPPVATAAAAAAPSSSPPPSIGVTVPDELTIHDNVVTAPAVLSDDLAPLMEDAEAISTILSSWRRKAQSSIVSMCHVDVYSLATMVSDTTTITKERDDKRKRLVARFKAYQRRLETYLGRGDIYACEECILDVWDEFFPHTSGIHYYDLETPVPRMKQIHQFLTSPCPKAIGTVQCEIERIKITSRGKGVKGRLFPIYEYRLFIRHRPIQTRNSETTNPEEGDNDHAEANGSNANFVRRDTVLMVAKNRGRKHTEPNSSNSGGIIPFTNTSNKKGSNNYYLYMAQQMDIDDHFRNCNPHLSHNNTIEPNGASRYPTVSSQGENTNNKNDHTCYDRNMLLGRLQSNFIGTEFQIYIPRIQKALTMDPIDKSHHNSASPPFHSDEEIDYDSGMSSDNNNNNAIRRSRFSRFRRSAYTTNHGGSNTTATTATTHPHPPNSTNSDSGSIATMTTPNVEYRTMKRTLSSPESLSSYRTMVGNMGHPHQRYSRTSRRAIANDTNNQNSSPSPQRQTPSSTVMYEEEAGVITYTANLLGSRPRIMDVCVPKVSSDGRVGLEWRQYVESCNTTEDETNVDDGSRMLSCFRQLQHRRDTTPPDQQQQPPPPQPIGLNHNNNNNNDVPVLTNPNHNNNVIDGTTTTETDGEIAVGSSSAADYDFGLLALQNRPPWWNAELGSFVLNFGGRVSVASVKNFQLCIRTNPDAILLQFGRIHGGRHSFTMDYSHPLTAVQAFSIAISSLQSKISFG